MKVHFMGTWKGAIGRTDYWFTEDVEANSLAEARIELHNKYDYIMFMSEVKEANEEEKT